MDTNRHKVDFDTERRRRRKDNYVQSHGKRKANRREVHLKVTECYFRAVGCSLDQTCVLVNGSFSFFFTFSSWLWIPCSISEQKKNAFVECWFSAISFWFFRFVLHSKAFEPPSSSIFERLWEKKILTKQKQYFQNSTLLLSDYFHQPSYSFWFISIHKQTNAFLCFYCSSRIGLLLEKNNVSTTTTLLNADLH